MIVSIFVPYSIGGWQLQAAYADSTAAAPAAATASNLLAALPPSASDLPTEPQLLRIPTNDPLDTPFSPEMLGPDLPQPPVPEVPQLDEVDRTAAVRDVAAETSARALRLAKFIPESDADGLAGAPLDALLAKAYTVRSSKGAGAAPSVRQYRPDLVEDAAAEESAPAAASEEPAPPLSDEERAIADADRLLDDGDALLREGRLRDAALVYFDVVNRYPDTPASEELDTIINALAWDAERNGIDAAELQRFTDALPAYADCASDKAIYWATAAQQITGRALKTQRGLEEATRYLETGRDMALAAMRDMPDSPYQIFFPGHYMLACRDLGLKETQAAMKSLHWIAITQKERNLLKMAIRHTMASTYNQYMNDVVEGGMQVANLLEEYPDSAVARTLEAKSVAPNILAHVEFVLGYAHYHMSHFGKARRHFETVHELYPDNYRLAEAAAYMSAYLWELGGSAKKEEILDAYYAYIDAYPDGHFVESAMTRMALIFERNVALREAAVMYRQLAAFFPENPQRDQLLAMAAEREIQAEERENQLTQAEEYLQAYGSAICGPYALALLMATQGKDADIRVLAEAAGMGEDGVSLAGLLAAAGATSLKVSVDRAEDVRQFSVPFIAHFQAGHFVFVSSVTDQEVVFDDLSGQHTVNVNDFNPSFSGYVLMLGDPVHTPYIDQETLEGVRGGCDSFWDDLSEAYLSCINQNCIFVCPVDTGTSLTSAGAAMSESGPSLGTEPPGPGLDSFSSGIPGFMPNASHPMTKTNIPFGSGSMGIDMGTNHRAFVITQTDISSPTRGPMDLVFSRSYFNPWGKHRDYHMNEEMPFKNNIGSGWRHNFNVHVRVSQMSASTAAFADTCGNFNKYERTQENENGYDIYKRAAEDWDGDDINATRHERSIIMRRSVAEGWFEMLFPDGNKSHFSAPASVAHDYCRLEWVEDVSGNRFTLTYEDCWVNTPIDGDPDFETNFGRLVRVDTPAGDDRYLQLIYSGNRITRVELRKPDGQNGYDVLKYVDYAYGAFRPYQQGDPTFDENFLRHIQADGDTDDATSFEYGYGGYGGNQFYPAKITDKKGKQLLVNCLYYQGVSYQVALTYPNGLSTVYNKPSSSMHTDIRSYDGQTPLARMELFLDDHSVAVEQAKYYTDPAGTACNIFLYGYANNYDLTGISKYVGGSLVTYVSYTYNMDGRALSSQKSGVYYRYEYPTGGGLYPVRQYGPGTATINGPMTEFVYDSANRVIQVKPPHLGPNGISYEYDSYGQVVSITGADGAEQSFTYDARGNRTSHTNADNHTWQYAYDDMGRMLTATDPNNNTTTYTYTGSCSSCSGVSGKIASMTLPDNSVMEYEYDNNGNMTKQIDPLGHETVFVYDNMDRLISITSEEGRTRSITYDKLGRMTSATDTGGKTTRYDYDYRGLVTRVWMATSGADDVLVQNVYDDIGRLVQVQDGKGQDINYVYNNRGQVTRTSHGAYTALNPSAGRIHLLHTYDIYGRLEKTAAQQIYPTIISNIDPVEYDYNDTTGLLSSKIFTNGSVVRTINYTYDVNGKLEQLADWASANASTDGHEFAYNNNGQLTTYTDYDGAELSYTYDALGRPTSMNAYETNNTYTYGYNAVSKLTSITAPGNRQWGFSYDAAGKLTGYTWPNGMHTEYTYDDDGRMNKILQKDNTTIKSGWSYVLGDDGNILSQQDERVNNKDRWDYVYDRRGRLTQAIHKENTVGRPDIRMNYVYDAADNMLSQTRYSLTSRVFDDFADNEYVSNPAWTVESGTWSAATGALVPTPGSGNRAIYTANTYGNSDVYFSFKIAGTGGLMDNWKVYLRWVDADNCLFLQWFWGALFLIERVGGVETGLANTAMGSVVDMNAWYDVQVQLDGSAVQVYLGSPEKGMKSILQAVTGLGTTTNRLRVYHSGTQPFEFDNFRVLSRSVNLTDTTTFIYNSNNQMTSLTNFTLTYNHTYDAWGRLITTVCNAPGGTFTRTYTYWFGDKLKIVTSNYPGETPEVQYNYDGLGKRRLRVVGSDTTYWRWDAGYSVVAQYQDTTPDWGMGALKRCFVPFRHSALAETDVDASGNPATAAYTYLALDHLGSARYGFNQSKSSTFAVRHLPFGQRHGTPTETMPYHEWTGKPWDADAKLFYFPYRYYSPVMNRWLGADPAGLIDGPNVYYYVNNNPIQKYDYLGLQASICRDITGWIDWLYCVLRPGRWVEKYDDCTYKCRKKYKPDCYDNCDEAYDKALKECEKMPAPYNGQCKKVADNAHLQCTMACDYI